MFLGRPICGTLAPRNENVRQVRHNSAPGERCEEVGNCSGAQASLSDPNSQTRVFMARCCRRRYKSALLPRAWIARLAESVHSQSWMAARRKTAAATTRRQPAHTFQAWRQLSAPNSWFDPHPGGSSRPLRRLRLSCPWRFPADLWPCCYSHSLPMVNLNRSRLECTICGRRCPRV